MDGSVSGKETALRRRLHQLLEQARNNEEKLRVFNTLELKLIATRSLGELVERLVSDLPAVFRLETVTLTLVDPQRELTEMLEQLGLPPRKLPKVAFVDSPDALAELFPRTDRPVLGRFSESAHGALYTGSREVLGSVALLPLRRGDDLWGSLNFGSADPRRYDAGRRSDFLRRLAAVVSICLENGVNHERLRQLGTSDPLTGVNNRRYFEERLREEVSASQRRNQPLTCMFLDIDHFKQFNDRYGHQAGDDVLREVATLIRSQLRRSDTLCRYGGEEFVLLMPNTARRSGRETAERIRQALAGHRFVLGGHSTVQVTVSIGIAVYSDCDESEEHAAQTLLRAADMAVYEAKEAGRNCVMVAAELRPSSSGGKSGEFPLA